MTFGRRCISVLLVMERGIHAASANPPSSDIIKYQGIISNRYAEAA